jgi:hypothetical protein
VDFIDGSTFPLLDVPWYSELHNWQLWDANKPFTKDYLRKSSYREYLYMKRRAQVEQKKVGKWVPTDDPFVRDFPNIDKEMSDCFWDDGKPRDPCSLFVRTGKSGASVYLNDPENKAGINTNGKTVREAMEALEAYLAAGEPTWRPQTGKKR